MDNLPLASMIVPIYNTSGYLESCLDSLLGQTYRNLQIILVDDGSTDGCGPLCDAFAQKDPRVQVIHQENGGVSRARNTGLEAARGDYVYFVDSDDLVAETMVEESVAVMEAGGCDLCAWRILMRDEEDPSKSRCWGHPRAAFFRLSTVRETQKFLSRWILNNRLGWSACCQAFRRDLIERNHLRFMDGQKICEDIDFLFRYTACCRNLRYLPKPFYIYRQHAGSTMHTNACQEKVAWMLRLAKAWKYSLADRTPFQPLYAFSGVLLSIELSNGLPKTEVEKQERAKIFSYYFTKEDREWLLEQARLAVDDRAEILRICGLPLGLRVWGFHKSLLTGNVTDFCRALWLQASCAALLELERHLFSKIKGMLHKTF